MFDYESYLREKLNVINNTRGLGLQIEIANEQAFMKYKSYTPDTIYVVIKKLGTTYMYDVLTQPIQLMIFAEQNQFDKTKALIDEFTNTYNWLSETIAGINGNFTYVKQQYSNAVVVNNFNVVGWGYRTMLYVTGDLAIMENVADVSATINNVVERGKILVDNHEVKPLTFNIAYTMTGNTQPTQQDKIATTMKTQATFSVAMSIQMVSSDFLNKILDITNGTTNGNEEFVFNFSINSKAYNIALKLTSCQITTSPNNIPTIQLGFMR